MKHLLLLGALICSALPVCAQTFEVNGQDFETPLGMESNADMESPIDSPSDQQFNRTELNLESQPFGYTSVGNLITVIANGNNNSIQINASQNNSGNQTVTFNGR